jgi:hypothetical protein
LEDEPEQEGEPGRESCEEAAWRFTLVQLEHGHAKKGFSCLEALVTYLQAELA